MPLLKVAILGTGRMGRALVDAVGKSGNLVLAGVWGRGGGAALAIRTDLDALLRDADVAIDFTLPEATAGILESVGRAAKPLVCGVTGLDDALLRRMTETARAVPLLYDRNMSIGIAVLTELVGLAASGLGAEFPASIHEIHHLHKRDAPSGTALKLGEVLARARGRNFKDVYRFQADGPRTRGSADEIIVTAERRGNVSGEHRVRFEADAETLTLEHAVTDRRVFANGALMAAAWLARQRPGLYGMRDVVQRGAVVTQAAIQ